MKTLATIILALATIFGTASPVTEAPAQSVSQQEADAKAMEQDAMATWDDYLDEPMTSGEFSYTWTAYAYEKPQSIPADCITLQSLDLGIWYVYQAHVLSHA